MSDDVRACSICGEPYSGDGNEAEPVHDGSCCDDCNERYVIPARLEGIACVRARKATAAIALKSPGPDLAPHRPEAKRSERTRPPIITLLLQP